MTRWNCVVAYREMGAPDHMLTISLQVSQMSKIKPNNGEMDQNVTLEIPEQNALCNHLGVETHM